MRGKVDHGLVPGNGTRQGGGIEEIHTDGSCSELSSALTAAVVPGTRYQGVRSERSVTGHAAHRTSQNFTCDTTAANRRRTDSHRALPPPMKGLTMTTPSQITASAPSFRSLLFNRSTILGVVAGAALAAGVGVSARAVVMGGWHHGMMMEGTHSAADVSAHVDHVLKHLYVEIEATDAQKAQIDPLVKQAVNDLLPLHSQLQTVHTHAIQALTQPTIDRTSLEAARMEHLQLADQASTRLVQLIADIGDVLTPTQRKSLTNHLEQLHGMPHS